MHVKHSSDQDGIAVKKRMITEEQNIAGPAAIGDERCLSLSPGFYHILILVQVLCFLPLFCKMTAHLLHLDKEPSLYLDLCHMSNVFLRPTARINFP
jgi:hypothetical protein